MSILERPTGPLIARTLRERGSARDIVESAQQSEPVSSFGRVILTLGIALVSSLLFTGRGLVHAGEGMHDGMVRSLTLELGHADLAVTEPLGLTGPWDRLQVALGRGTQSDVPPLLVASAISPLVSPSASTVPARGARQFHLGAPRSSSPPVLYRPTPLPPLRSPSRRAPLRLLVTGDSLPGFFGPQILDGLGTSGRVRGSTDVHDGTGLTRPDYVDWSIVARQQVANSHPEAIIVMMGGNDFQNMVVGNGRVLIAGTSIWATEYARRAAVCMRIWTEDQPATHRVYWLSLPPARDRGWAFDFAQINHAIRTAAHSVRGARYLNILGPVTDHGRYVDYVKIGGQPTLIREADGVHLNVAGSQLVANELLPFLRRKWHI